ncbi:glucan synthase subunit [Scheffersomyces xylosifermentans]|uniref:glucan synthase subunit n=1 Tax=Scheffersomyces xylosifermentans TaxID=1304137 RepID=UPI00315C8618
MVIRDLTANDPKLKNSETDESHTSPETYTKLSPHASTISSYSNSAFEEQLNFQFGRTFTAYQEDGESPLPLLSFGSEDRIKPEVDEEREAAIHRFERQLRATSPLQNRLQSRPTSALISVPPEFDRYPSMVGSRIVSSTSLQNLLNIPASLDNREEADLSSVGSHPNRILSPFGGFPSSSFPLHIEEKEADDHLHNPDPIEDAEYSHNKILHDLKSLDKRSLTGILSVVFLILIAIGLFVLLPALTYTGLHHRKSKVVDILSNYQYPLLSAIRTSLIDPDTPDDAYNSIARDGSTWSLVFSDEFNTVGRTFYQGDDQFFTALDLHYDATKDLEWYDPDAVTTSNGTLILTLDAIKNHDLFYRSGMVSSWNQFCFTEGKIVISARLPNYGNITGLWPGLWTMGNLARPGFLASSEGVWPYSYDSCDVGITPNQSSPDGISYLPGQRLNSCTCGKKDHPNPGVGRGAPEIDIIEAEVASDKYGRFENRGIASQSLQIAPMDIWYYPDYDFVEIHNASITTMNTYTGGPIQQAISAVTSLNSSWYERGNGLHNYQVYGFEYLNDNDNGYLTWFVGNEPTFTMHATALHPNGNIGWRRISKEPMSIIMNLGVSNSWSYIDWPSIVFPSNFRIDYVRVYQPQGNVNVGCDPVDYPTYDYIQQHLDIYSNPNLTTFESAGYSFPKNKLLHC